MKLLSPANLPLWLLLVSTAQPLDAQFTKTTKPPSIVAYACHWAPATWTQPRTRSRTTRQLDRRATARMPSLRSLPMRASCLINGLGAARAVGHGKGRPAVRGGATPAGEETP